MTNKMKKICRAILCGTVALFWAGMAVANAQSAFTIESFATYSEP